MKRVDDLVCRGVVVDFDGRGDLILVNLEIGVVCCIREGWHLFIFVRWRRELDSEGLFGRSVDRDKVLRGFARESS